MISSRVDYATVEGITSRRKTKS